MLPGTRARHYTRGSSADGDFGLIWSVHGGQGYGDHDALGGARLGPASERTPNQPTNPSFFHGGISGTGAEPIVQLCRCQACTASTHPP